MPEIVSAGTPQVQLTNATNTVDVEAATATLDEAAVQYLTSLAALYGWDGATLSRLKVETATNPNLRLALYEGATLIGQGDTPADALTQPSSILDALTLPHLFNGATWDRARNNHELTLLASASRSGDTTTAEQTNYDAKGVVLYLDITARTVGGSPTIVVGLETFDPVTGNQENMVSISTFDPTLVEHLVLVYPSASMATGNQVRGHIASPLPRAWAARIAFVNNITNITYSLSASYVK